MVTQSEIARQLGLDVSSVNKILNRRSGPVFRTETVERVFEVAQRMGYNLDKLKHHHKREHPRRPITGFDCTRSEVSGRRLWGLFAGRFPDPEDFFADHFVANYCPLVWMKETGANLTPDKIPAESMSPVNEACLAHLRVIVERLSPQYLIGVGAYAEKQLRSTASELGSGATIGKILHPSPASPAANRDWAGTAARQLEELGVW